MVHSQHLNFSNVLVILILCLSCKGKLLSDSDLLNPPTQKPIGDIEAREKLLKALMASHAEIWSDSERYFHEAYQADPHATIGQLHTQIQQASKTMKMTNEER